MSNFSKMLEVNKASSVEKEEKAVKEITKMIESDFQVTVAELVKRTGLSRAFFYKNPIAVAALKDAREKQKGKSFTNPTKVILDKAMEKQIEVLKKENEKLKAARDRSAEHPADCTCPRCQSVLAAKMEWLAAKLRQGSPIGEGGAGSRPFQELTGTPDSSEHVQLRLCKQK